MLRKKSGSFQVIKEEDEDRYLRSSKRPNGS